MTFDLNTAGTREVRNECREVFGSKEIAVWFSGRNRIKDGAPLTRQSDMQDADWRQCYKDLSDPAMNLTPADREQLGETEEPEAPGSQTETADASPAPEAPVSGSRTDPAPGDLSDMLAGMRGFGMDKAADQIQSAVDAMAAERDRANRAAAEHKAEADRVKAAPAKVVPMTPTRPGQVVTKSTGKKNAGELFPGSRSLKARGIMVDVCDYQGAAPDPNYLWNAETPDMLAALADGESVLISGSKGVGKSSWARNLAALLGRPYIQIGFHAETSSADLFGFMGPAEDGGMSWVRGDLLDAMQTPFAIVDLSEISFARPELIPQLFSVLEASDKTVRTADGVTHHVDPTVWFIATSNDNGTGEQSHKYHGTQALNPALVSRFGWRVEFTAPDATRLAKLVAKQTGVPLAVGRVLADFEKAMAKGVGQGHCGDTPGIRALLSWAKAVKRGTDSRVAFVHAVLNWNPQEDSEYWAARANELDPHTAIAQAMANPGAAPDPAPADAGPDFDQPTRAGFGEI